MITEIPLQAYLVLASLLFCIGVWGLINSRNAVRVLMSIELMLNAVNINFIAAAAFKHGGGLFTNFDGHILTIFIITIAAAEVGLALALILRIFRNKSTVNVDQFDMMKL